MDEAPSLERAEPMPEGGRDRGLDAAESRWQGLSRPQILVRLALEGHRVAQQEHDENRRRRLAASSVHSGILTGAYGRGLPERLREEWPS